MTATLKILPVLVLLGTGLLARAEGAHVHGAVRLDVALDGPVLSVALEAPLDSLLGFERPPRNAAERQAADALLARLRSAKALVAADAAAQCVLQSATAESAVLKPGARAGDHADMDASFEFRCARPELVSRLDLGGLLDAFPRISRLEAQIVTPKGQFRQTLQRPARVLGWGRG